MLKKLTDMLQEARNLALMWLRVEGHDRILLRTAKRLTTKSHSNLSRAIPSMLHMHSSREEQHGVAREVRHGIRQQWRWWGQRRLICTVFWGRREICSVTTFSGIVAV
jgi:hypothetical protein